MKGNKLPKSPQSTRIDVLLLFLLFLLFFPKNAQTYFVSVSGSDSHDGRSLATAWRTLNKAATLAGAGATVNVADGTYPERVIVSTSGAPGLPITFQARGRAVVEGFVIRASYIHVLGFEITNRNQSEEIGQGIRILGSHNLVSHNSIYNLCFEGIFLAGGPTRDSAAPSDNTISDNTVRAAEMAAIHIEGRENVIENNDLSDTRQYPLGCPRRNRADADGIRFFGLRTYFQQKSYSRHCDSRHNV
jgi:parallel beta-helix repeat protein